MDTIKIDLTKIEKICKKFGYSPSEIEDFKKKFSETFLLRVGKQMEEHLTEEQREHIQQLLNNKKTTLSDLASYLKTIGLEDEAKKISQKTFDQMTTTVLERLAMLTTDEQYKTMKKMLFA